MVIYYFIMISMVAFLILFSYIAYDYRQALKQHLTGSLSVMAEDIIRHGSYELPADKLKGSFHHLEAYHDDPFVGLFDDLSFSYAVSHPEDEDGSLRFVRRLPDDRYLIISSTLKTIDERSSMFILRHLLVFATILILFILVFDRLLKRLFRPLSCLVRFCDDSSTGHQGLPLCQGTSEVDALREAIVGLIKTNQRLCENREDIFKEAVHEIKSPIAILKARFYLFKQRSEYERGQFIQEGLEDIDVATHRLKELLFLKSIELDLQKREETISVKEQYQSMQKTFEPILEKKRLRLESDMRQDFTLVVQKDAMIKVMQAIFENIFMHTKNGSVIRDHIDPEKYQMLIINEIGTKSDETLFSSYIGSKIISRLSKKLGYTYITSEDGIYFYTTITFETRAKDPALPVM